MTVIAYRDGIIACDSGAFSGNVHHNYALKIARSTNGTLYGAVGILAEGQTYLDWVRRGCEGPAPEIRIVDDKTSDDAIHILRIRPGYDPEQITGYGINTWHGAPYAAIGSACEPALGALHHGASAVEAVEAAIAHHNHALGPVRSLRHIED